MVSIVSTAMVESLTSTTPKFSHLLYLSKFSWYQAAEEFEVPTIIGQKTNQVLPLYFSIRKNFWAAQMTRPKSDTTNMPQAKPHHTGLSQCEPGWVTVIGSCRAASVWLALLALWCNIMNYQSLNLKKMIIKRGREVLWIQINQRSELGTE